ncbi:MAG: NAD(P)-dependent oxidoreductase [Pseudoxanthomonas sp.]
MSLVLTGATSQIGHFLRPRLAQRQTQVTAISRKPQTAGLANETWLQTDLASGLIAATLPQADALVSFGPLDNLGHWLDAQAQLPFKRVIVTSSMSVLSKATSDDAVERALVARLQAGEAAVQQTCERLGIAWTILRPTLIYGAGLDKSLTPIARRAMRTRLFPIPMAQGLRQPVHADDIAQAVIAALEGQADNLVVQVGGGERLPYHQMFRRVRDSLPVATLPVFVPHAALRALTRLKPGLRGPVSRLDVDLVADNTILRERLGVTPRAFLPSFD